MDQNEFAQAVKTLDSIDPSKLPQLVGDIKATLDSYSGDYNKLGHALYKLCDHIMKQKDIKNEYLPHFEQLINEAIRISIKNEYRVGYDALRYVFNPTNQFYKSANLDTALNYPLGRERALKSYNPVVGQECDVVRPYITSTSFCGWTRCKVVQIENHKYTIKYNNSDSPQITRQTPFFAPLGTRMKDYQWRMGLDVGEPIQAYLNRVWYKATVAEVGFEEGYKKIRVTYRRFAEKGDREDSFGNRYFGLKPSEDQWMDVLSPRIQMGGMADVKLCYYTFTSQQILLDDFYDMIFEQEYSQKQFFAIARIIVCKSSSLLTFINTFVQNKGIQKVMDIMDKPEINDEAVFAMLANIGVMVPFYPRMFVKRSPLYQLYGKITNYFKTMTKVLNPMKIDAAYFCYDMIGRRLFSLTQVYHDQNNLRKMLIKQFLKMNLQKQMLALRYLNDLIFPKKPYSKQQREQFNNFLKEQNIYSQIFQPNTHEQIISRTGSLLQYMLQFQIITQRDFENLWNIAPLNDQRGRVTIQKLLTDITKKLPISCVQILIQKILSLKQTQLTIDNLNLLRELKNRNIGNDYQMKMLSFLWDVLTVKSGNVKIVIEEEVQKVFKAFVSTIKDPKIRMNVLQSMSQKLQQCKKVKNEIQLLKDFIKSYPEKLETLPNQVIDQTTENIPMTIYQAVAFVKEKQIYNGLLNLLFRSKDQGIKKDILNFISFLFEYDSQDINQTIRQIYRKLRPSVNFLNWIHKLLPRSLQFVTELLQNTTQFAVFQKITSQDFDAIRGMIYDVNTLKKNLKVVTTYEYKSSTQNKNQNAPGFKPVTGDASDKKQQKFIGPLLPQAKKHIYSLVSPFKLVGMKFVENLLQVVKQKSIYNSIIKLIIQFISNLDESIQSKTQQFRKQFLQQIVKEIRNIVIENKCDEKIKQKMLVYIKLLYEIFGETQKNGIGNLEPHFEKVEGEKLTLYIENLFDKEKNKEKNKESIPKFTIVVNENITIWRFKRLMGDIIDEKPESIDIIKYIDPMGDDNNGKSLTQLSFYNKETLKINRKPSKMIPRSSLLNDDGTDVSPKFEKIIRKLFEQYQNLQTNGLGIPQMQKMSNQKWKNSLFREKGRVQKVFEQHDKDKKGYLTYNQFKEFFYMKSVKNQNAVWRLINLSGYRNNFTSSNQKQSQTLINIQALPRRILSNSNFVHLIFSILSNQTFKDLHIEFYKLLQRLEVDQKILKEVQNKLYQIIAKQNSIYYLCYALEVANSELSKRAEFYLQFWKTNGVQVILQRISQIFVNNKSVYELDLLVKDAILPGFMKILNMYVSQLLYHYKIVRFTNQNRINYMELQDFVKKFNEINELVVDPNLITQNCKKLHSINSSENVLQQIYNTSHSVFMNIIKNFVSQKTDFSQKLTAQVVRLIVSLIGSSNQYGFDPLQYIIGIRNQSLNCRRSTAIILYIYVFYSSKQVSNETQKILNKLLQEMPSQNKIQNYNYFSLLNQIIQQYLSINKANNETDKFFVTIGNNLLDRLFQKVQGQSRNSLLSDKIVLGIFSIIQTIIKKDSIGKAFCDRKIQIVEKCLFVYNIQEKLKDIEITPQMLKTQSQAQHFKNYVMCKTEDSRNLVYNVVARLHQLSGDSDPNFINKYILPIVRNINPQVRITSSKSLQVGLKNFGSTCYMNSMLQVLNSVGPFRNSLMQCQSEAPIVREMKKLFAALYFSERMDYAPTNLLTAFVPPINPGIQQDTTQFLNFLFDQLQAALGDTQYKKLLDEIFKGANTVQMICQSCGYKKQNRQQFFSFGVEIQNKFDLHNALQGTYQGQVINDYTCDSCHQKVDMTKRNILSEIPNVMFIHLRRIVFNYDMFVNMKIHTRLHFPEQLNIEPYTKQGVQLRQQFGLQYMKNLSHNEEEMKKFQQLALHGKDKDFYKLKLKGIIVHSGSADVGHYYSVLPNQKMWRKYDDSRIGIFTNSNFESECYGGTFTSEEWGSGSSVNAYVLVYEKVVKNPIKIFKKNQNMQEQVVIPFDEIKVYNSAQDYRQLWIDNHNFMVESQLLDSRLGKGFINFVSKLILDSPPYINKVQLISEVIYKISIHSGIVGELMNTFIANANQVTPLQFYLYVTNDKAITFKLLFSNDKPVRDFMASYLHIVLMQTYKKGDQSDKQKVIAYITQLLNAMVTDVAKNWLRVDGYFKFLFSLVCSSLHQPQLWNLFRARNMISNLIDYVMQKQSPVRINPKNYSLGTKSNPMDFSYGVSIIFVLLKHSYGFNGKNYQAPAVPEHLLFHLNDNDVICLSHIEFYRKMLRERQNLQDLAAIIQRLCIMNLQFSKAIIDAVLQTICSITEVKDEMIDLSNVCLEILKIRDDYWINRAQLLLGICMPYVQGNNLMTTFDEERFVFTSTLYDVFPVQSLLSYVYLYRLKNTLASFQLLRAIIQGCSVSDIAMKYLARLPSPSYLFSNFVQWIQFFISNFLKYVTVQQKHKQRLQSQIQNTKKYIQDLKQYIRTHPQVNYYQSVVTGEISNKKQIQTIQKDGIQIKVYEYTTFCVKSAPHYGEDKNMERYLQSSRLSKNVSNNSNILNFFKKPGKTIALKLQPVEQDEDKQLIGLFDENPNPPKQPQSSNNVGTQMEDVKNFPTIQQVKADEEKKKSTQSPKMPQAIQKIQEPQIDVNLQGVLVNNYFRQIQVNNRSKEKKIVRIIFHTNENSNFILPHEMVWKIFAKNNQTIWIAKQDCNKEWDKIQMKVYVQQYVKEKHEKKTITSWWFKTYGQKELENENAMQNQNLVQESKQEQVKDAQNDANNDGLDDFIECKICTLLNPSTNIACDACFTDLR